MKAKQRKKNSKKKNWKPRLHVSSFWRTKTIKPVGFVFITMEVTSFYEFSFFSPVFFYSLPLNLLPLPGL